MSKLKIKVMEHRSESLDDNAEETILKLRELAQCFRGGSNINYVLRESPSGEIVDIVYKGKRMETCLRDSTTTAFTKSIVPKIYMQYAPLLR